MYSASAILVGTIMKVLKFGMRYWKKYLPAAIIAELTEEV